MKRRAALFAVGALAAAGSAVALKPQRRASRDLPPIQLDQQVPLAFEGWTLDKTLVPVLPDPSLQAALDKIYGQVLARTYVNARGQRVMLSIAYGEDQGTDATAAHRPEFCYTAQGFSVVPRGEATLDFGGHLLRVRRLVGSLQTRREPITYWVTLNNTAVLPGVSWRRCRRTRTRGTGRGRRCGTSARGSSPRRRNRRAGRRSSPARPGARWSWR